MRLEPALNVAYTLLLTIIGAFVPTALTGPYKLSSLLLFVTIQLMVAIDRFAYYFPRQVSREKPRLDSIWPSPLIGNPNLQFWDYVARLSVRDGHLYTVCRSRVKY